MPNTISLMLTLLAALAAPRSAEASDNQRIEQMLAHDTYSADGGVLLSTARAKVSDCTIQLELVRIKACENTDGHAGKTSLIDVRALRTAKDEAKVTDFTGTKFESLNGAVTYRYRRAYNRVLEFANEVEARSRDEEIANFPNDVGPD